MSWTLRQTQTTAQRLDLRGLLPGTLRGLSDGEIHALPVPVGNASMALGELFMPVHDADAADDLLVIETLDGRLDHVGAALADGTLRVRGDVGDFAGRAMQGGELLIEGTAGDFAGSGLRGGTLRVDGDAGDYLGAPAAGERQGQRGGVIHVRGSVGTRAGECQRRGLLIVEGDAGDLLGHRMIAGTLYVGGRAGALTGYGMRRGSLVLRQRPRQLAETLRENGRHRLAFLPLLLQEIQRLSAGSVAFADTHAAVARYLGDPACAGRGEVLILD